MESATATRPTVRPYVFRLVRTLLLSRRVDWIRVYKIGSEFISSELKLKPKLDLKLKLRIKDNSLSQDNDELVPVLGVELRES